MKTTIISIIFIFCFFINGVTQERTSQTIYDSIETNSGVIIGEITLADFKANKDFKWIKPEISERLISTLLEKIIDNGFSFTVFLGMWCSDSKAVIPEFIEFLALKNIPESRVLFYGLDRNKKGLADFTNEFNITNVPTIIAKKNGIEVFRVVEQGNTGNWQDDFVSNFY